MYLQDFELLKHAGHDLVRILTHTLDITNRLYKLHIVSQSEYYSIISLIGIKLRLPDAYSECISALPVKRTLARTSGYSLWEIDLHAPINPASKMRLYVREDKCLPPPLAYYRCLWGELRKPNPKELQIPDLGANPFNSSRKDLSVCDPDDWQSKKLDHTLSSLLEMVQHDKQHHYLGTLNRTRVAVSIFAKIPSMSAYADGYTR